MKQSLSEILERVKNSKYFCLLNPNGYRNGFPLVVGVGDTSVLWEHLADKSVGTYFGFLSYDFKNELFEGLSSNHIDWQRFPSSTFFKAKELFNRDDLIDDLDANNISLPEVRFDAKVDRESYVSTVNEIREDILNGDVYELNYCIPFVADFVELDPVLLYKKLNGVSPMPFSCLLKLDSCWLICASPERYAKKKGREIISQPIKGTIKRGKTKKEDEYLVDQLKFSEKEQAENLMIVDLVRNDFNRCCTPTTVHVDELFGVYDFPQVHQMVSTISGELEDKETVKTLVEKTFPMGSMTGAPKLKALELIEKYEVAKRGIFSGAVGYINETNDTDFNVVIRSLMYNQKTKKLSFMVGSAITFDSDPEKEYEECLLKASAIMKCFEKK